jgi:hypothetical protein
MERADRPRRYNRLRTEAPSAVQRLELGMLDAAILTYDLGRTVWARDPVGDWPNPNQRDDP